LDYLTSPGYLDGGDSRERSGLFLPGSGPSMLLSTKGVFKFHPQTKELYLAQIHPGVKLQDVRKEIPWDLKVAQDLSETQPPTADEISFIRHFAPGQVAGRNLVLELNLANLDRKAKRSRNNS
jgi:glutaconate CoA-transferase subunit B